MAGRIIEGSDYVAFMERIIEGFGRRAEQDPAVLAHLADLLDRLADAGNTAIFATNANPDQRRRFSQRELGAIMGISKQAVQQRIGRGRALYAARVEREQAGAPLVRLADVRARRAELLTAAGITDTTGSDREQAAQRALRAV